MSKNNKIDFGHEYRRAIYTSISPDLWLRLNKCIEKLQRENIGKITQAGVIALALDEFLQRRGF